MQYKLKNVLVHRHIKKWTHFIYTLLTISHFPSVIFFFMDSGIVFSMKNAMLQVMLPWILDKTR